MSDEQPSLRDRAMALLLELQQQEREEINAGERQALSAYEERKKADARALGFDPGGNDDD